MIAITDETPTTPHRICEIVGMAMTLQDAEDMLVRHGFIVCEAGLHSRRVHDTQGNFLASVETVHFPV